VARVACTDCVCEGSARRACELVREIRRDDGRGSGLAQRRSRSM
jgi:hypothetical protein